jgi:hypothetical protein
MHHGMYLDIDYFSSIHNEYASLFIQTQWICITFHPHTMIYRQLINICYIIGAWISNQEETRQLVYAFFKNPVSHM